MAVDFEKINSYREKIQPRDNTRVSNKLEPRLKKEEEKKLPDNRTYLSQAPSKEIINANNLSHTLKQIQDFGDKLKQVGLDLRDYAAVGTSMLNPAAGMVLGLGDAGISAAKGDYVSGGVQAGLEMLPYIGKLLKQVPKRTLKNNFSSLSQSAESIDKVQSFNIDKNSLPNYAKPNWQGDQLELVKKRLSNGGFDRLEEMNGGVEYTVKQQKTADKLGVSSIREIYPERNDFSPEFRKRLLESKPKVGTSSEFNSSPGTGATSNRREDYYTSMFTDAPAEFQTPYAQNTAPAHEFAHFVYNPKKVPSIDIYDLTPDNPHRDYLMMFGKPEMGTELTARGTQIKNYFGLDKDYPVTEDMLKYAADNYVKDTGFDNVMTDFFKGIKDYKGMAKFITDHSPVITLPLMLMNYDNKNTQRTNTKRSENK